MKTGKRMFTLLFTVILVFTMLPVQTRAGGKVKLNKTKVTAYIGSSTTLKVYGTRKKVTWTSGNKRIATVSSKGKVTPKKTGKVTITAKVSGKKYKCSVTVKKPYINVSKKAMYVGNSYTLKLTGTRMRSAKTSNKRVAIVSSKGKVTAKSAGKATITCKGKNGKSYQCKVTVKEVHVHKYTGAVIKEATCKETGTMTYTCSCGDSYTESIKKLEHSYTKTVFSTPTCCESGWTHYECKYCGDAFEEEAKAMGHEYASETVEPTCKEAGYTVYTCKNCGYSYKDNYTEQLIHSFIETILKEPTCYECGRASYKCKYCGYAYEKELEIEHKWVESYVAPTCTSTGGTYVECTECHQGFFKGEMEEILPHEYEETVVEATCEERGYTVFTCKNCGYGCEDNYVEPKGHCYQRKVTKEPDCEWEGESWNVCELCGAKEWGTDEEIPPLGHAYEGMVDGTGRMIACTRCAGELLHVSCKIDEKYGAMVTMDDKGMHMMAGTGLTLLVDDMTGGIFQSDLLSLELADGEYRENEEGTNSYYDNAQATIFREAKKLFARESGTTKLLFRYEDDIIDTVDVNVTGYSLAEVVRRTLNGETNAAEGYTEEYVQMIQTASSVIQDNITADMTDYEKVKKICHWIEANIEYGTTGTREGGQRASEAITKKMAVCGGFAETFYFFMEVLDIPCYYITGIGENVLGPGPHAWNLVQIDTGNGKGVQWYCIDTTWGEHEYDKTVEEINTENGVIGVWGKHEAVGGYTLQNSAYFGEGGWRKVQESFLPE